MKVGIFGGSFDPVHLGHLMVAHTAREEAGLDKLVLVPAARSPFKPGHQPAPDGERLRMLRLALAGLAWCEVEDLELRRGGVSYTVDTVRELQARHSGARLFYLIGADNTPGLPQWREAEELARRVEFLVIPRPGESATLPTLFRGQVLKGFPVGISSTDIRTRASQGLEIGHLVPRAVEEAIRNYRLYSGPVLGHCSG